MITVIQKESCVVLSQRRRPLLESPQVFLSSCLFAKKSEKVLIRAKALEKEGDVGPSRDATRTR